jgi:deoxyribodipyrimidine photo-lyase
MDVNPNRIKRLNSKEPAGNAAAYWMSRDQRVSDNWAIIYARQLAQERKAPLLVCFCLAEDYPGANIRHFAFMLKGLKQVYEKLMKKNIPFCLLNGDPVEKIPEFVRKNNIGTLVTDFDPLSIKRKWKSDVAGKISIPFYEVDAHNIVPCRHASQKQEYGAYTLRPKINRALGDFLEDFPPLKENREENSLKQPQVDFEKILEGIRTDRSVGEVDVIEPGEKGAQKTLDSFIGGRIDGYGSKRNNPDNDMQSGLSPYLHFGNISAQRIAMEVLDSNAGDADRDPFLEQLIIRRELSDNYCYYNSNYDSFEGFPSWARKTLDDHRGDPREYIYEAGKLEGSLTHDRLWNAAQSQMVITGRMHGYMRMYWAKKILEWSPSPDEAQETAIYLNDKYSLDGRDPNGYAGIAWSMGGVHDRAWGERAVFGKIRYMSYNGARSKFDVKSYINRIEGLEKAPHGQDGNKQG